jgi:hypothetical protein
MEKKCDYKVIGIMGDYYLCMWNGEICRYEWQNCPIRVMKKDDLKK